MIRDCLVATLKRVWPADLRSGTGFSAGAGGGGGGATTPPTKKRSGKGGHISKQKKIGAQKN